jgi:hypothetical protein
MRSAMVACFASKPSATASNQSAAALIESSLTAAMCRPPTRTQSASGLSRWPLQASQGASDM